MNIALKNYLRCIVECLMAFSIATFCMAMYFIHTKGSFLPGGALLITCYLFVIFFCAKRFWERLPLAFLMILIPIIPLVPLTLILLFIPLMQCL